MQPSSAASGAEALTTLRAAAAEGKPYDLALLDMRMTEMDGFMLASAIKIDPVIGNTQLIVLTSVGQALSAAELNKAGIEAYLVKPVRQSRLFDCLVNVIGKHSPKKIVAFSPVPVAAKVNPNANVHILSAKDDIANK
jgi:two-component system sensor histidine kinase/response regulator